MNLTEKIKTLSEELGVPYERICYVIGMKADELELAVNGDEKFRQRAENFFSTREYAMSQYTDDQNETIRKFERLVAAEKTQKAASEKVGIGQSIMSGLRKGNYSGKVNEKFAELAEYFKVKEEKQKLPEIFKPVDYAPTRISLMIYERLRSVHILGGCAVITGDAGVGKTKTIQKYAKDNKTKTIVITASVFNHTATDVLYLLAEELGISETNKTQIKRLLFSRLHDGMMIIVDEAQELTYQAANALRAIPDYFEAKGESVGLAFVGNPCFYNKFNGRYTSDRVQVSSRFVAEATYTSEQIDFEDTKMLYPQLVRQGMFREIMFLHCIATTPSLGQRKALFIFKNAYDKGKYDLNALVKEAKSEKIRFENINSILKKIEKQEEKL